jgi:hypothetical protein
MMIQAAQQRAIDAMLKNRRDENRKIKTTKPGTSGGFIPTKKTKKTTPVTGTTKPGTGGGRDSKPTTGGFSAPTKQGQSPRGTTTTSSPRQTAREDRRGGQYGFASGGLARMLGE